jgi:hypothetical protein
MTLTRRVFVTAVSLALHNYAARADDTLNPIRWPPALQQQAERMILRSPTFRSQYERLERTSGLQVVVRWAPGLEQRSYRARSTIQRLRTGGLLAVVAISPHGNRAELIAHEFEHILEQIERLHLPTLAGSSSGVWQSGRGMYETERAIRAGRTVADEVRFEARSDNLVE